MRSISAMLIPASRDPLAAGTEDIAEAATVLELLRYISHVPLALPHFTTDDTSVAGFTVKKHTKVAVLLVRFSRWFS